MAHRTTQQIITRHNTLKEDAINAIWEWLKHYQFNELVVFEEQAQQLKDENNHLTFHGIHHHGSESTIDVICYDGSKEQFSVHISSLEIGDLTWLLTQFENEYIRIHDWHLNEN